MNKKANDFEKVRLAHQEQKGHDKHGIEVIQKNRLMQQKESEKLIPDLLIKAVKEGNINQNDSKSSEANKLSIEYLLKNGAKINELDSYGNLPIIVAVDYNKLDVIDFLQSKGASLDQLDARGYSALHRAIENKNIEIFDHLIAKNANINIIAGDGNNILHSAVANSDYNFVAKILPLKIAINVQNKYGDTVLHIAASKGIEQIFNLIFNHELINKKIFNEHGIAAIHSAAISNKEKIIEIFAHGGFDINFPDKYGKTPLMYAIIYGNISVIQKLISLGADLNIKDDDNLNVFDYVLKYNNKQIQAILESAKLVNERNKLEQANNKIDKTVSIHKAELDFRHKYITKPLIQGKKLDDLNEQNTSLLHIAASYGYENTLSQLIEDVDLKLNINLRDGRGNTPLYAAIKGINYLIELGVVSQNELSSTQIEYAMANSVRALNYLINAGADIYIANYDNQYPIHTAAQIGNHIALRAIYSLDPKIIELNGNDGFKPIHYAMIAQQYEILLLMITEMKANIHSKDNFGNKIIDYGNQILADKLSFNSDLEKKLKELMKFFLDHGLTYSIKNSCSKKFLSPTEQAIKDNKFDLVEKFKNYNFSPYNAILNNDFETIIEFINHGFDINYDISNIKLSDYAFTLFNYNLAADLLKLEKLYQDTCFKMHFEIL